MIRLIATFFLIGLGTTALQAKEVVRLAVTTSFHNSGLSDVLLPRMEKDLDLTIQLLVVGTGQALRLGRAGDVDAVLVHSRKAEDDFIAKGYGTHRREIMFNDFVFIGPADDPARVQSGDTVFAALVSIAMTDVTFVSRGDDSGTHRRERALWKSAGITASGKRYREAGAGMGTTLNVASGLNAYTISDRASWLNFANKGDLKLLFSGDPALFNQYTFMPVSQTRHAHVNANGAARLEDWLTSPAGQEMIGAYTINGETVFTPNAK